MTPEERNRLAEQWLETALKPRSPEPRPGLESRILAAVEAEKSVARSPLPVSRFAFRVPRFVWPVAAGLVLASVLGIYWSHRPQTRGVAIGMTTSRAVPATARTGASDAAQQAQNIPTLRSAQDGAPRRKDSNSSETRFAATQAVGHERVASARLKPRPFEYSVQQRLTSMQRESPRLEQFPAPRPLSEQERLLLAYLRSTPREEILLVAQRQAEDQIRRQRQFGRDSIIPASGAAALDGTTEEK